MIPTTLVITTLLAFANTAPRPAITEIFLDPRVPSQSECHCELIADQQYTINLYIVNKTTEEKGQLSQGFQDNFGVFCKGYRNQWGEVVPLATDPKTGEMKPAFDAPSTLGAHISMAGGDYVVSGYSFAFDLQQHEYDGCLTDVIKQAENQTVVCQCPKYEPTD